MGLTTTGGLNSGEQPAGAALELPPNARDANVDNGGPLFQSQSSFQLAWFSLPFSHYFTTVLPLFTIISPLFYHYLPTRWLQKRSAIFHIAAQACVLNVAPLCFWQWVWRYASERCAVGTIQPMRPLPGASCSFGDIAPSRGDAVLERTQRAGTLPAEMAMAGVESTMQKQENVA